MQITHSFRLSESGSVEVPIGGADFGGVGIGAGTAAAALGSAAGADVGAVVSP